jgi:Spy/CpxP family protein refolding chaperone
MIKITGTALVAAAMFLTSSAFAGNKAGDKACCARTVANNEKQGCADLTALNLTADQKTKIEAWQAECMNAGCSKESRHKFLQQAKGILSAEQFAKLKAECKKNWPAKETKTET